VSTTHYNAHTGAITRARSDLLSLSGIGGIQPAIGNAVAFGVLKQRLEGRCAPVADKRERALRALHQQQAPRCKRR